MDSMSFTGTVLWIILYKIQFHIGSAFLFKIWKGTLMVKKSCKCHTCIFDRLLYGFGIGIFNPCFIGIVWNKLMIQPYTKAFARYKRFTVIVQFLIVSYIEIVNIPTSSNRFMNFHFLFAGWIDFRLEAP